MTWNIFLKKINNNNNKFFFFERENEIPIFNLIQNNKQEKKFMEIGLTIVTSALRALVNFINR